MAIHQYPIEGIDTQEQFSLGALNKVDLEKNEKNAVRYEALKICPIHIVSHIAVIACSKGMSIIFFNAGAYGLLRVSER